MRPKIEPPVTALNGTLTDDLCERSISSILSSPSLSQSLTKSVDAGSTKSFTVAVGGRPASA
jgi:hypothetical protein